MESLMDSVMEKVAGREWHYEALSLPLVGHLPISEIAEPITIEQFLQAACRRCDHVKSTTILFDVHFKVSEFGGLARVGELIQQGELDHLPLPLCLSGKLPPSAKMGAVIQNLEDGTMNVVKVLHFPEKVSVTHVAKLCTGNAYVPVFRQGEISSLKRQCSEFA